MGEEFTVFNIASDPFIISSANRYLLIYGGNSERILHPSAVLALDLGI